MNTDDSHISMNTEISIINAGIIIKIDIEINTNIDIKPVDSASGLEVSCVPKIIYRD